MGMSLMKRITIPLLKVKPMKMRRILTHWRLLYKSGVQKSQPVPKA